MTWFKIRDRPAPAGRVCARWEREWRAAPAAGLSHVVVCFAFEILSKFKPG
jgi:hypothetical protein